jgi:hypothetical protein
VLVAEGPIPRRLLGEDVQEELARYFDSLGGRPIPPRYANLADSPLSAQVLPQQKTFTFELKR